MQQKKSWRSKKHNNILMENGMIHCCRCQNVFTKEHFNSRVYTKNGETKEQLICKEHNKKSIEVQKNKLRKNNNNFCQTSEDYTRDRYYRIKYNICLEDYDKILKSQNHCCAICRKNESDFVRKLAVDHNHSNGKIRGLLCYNCNTALGKLQDDKNIIQCAINYLFDNKMPIINECSFKPLVELYGSNSTDRLYYRDKALRRNYGISLFQYDMLLKKQNNKCLICKRTEKQTGKTMHVDHCHDTLKIRGILCNNCNTAIGQLKYDKEILTCAINYLKKL